MSTRVGIRGRIALWFGVVSSGLVLVFSVLVYWSVWQSMLSGVDRELSARAEALFDRCTVGPDGVEFEPPQPGEGVLGGLTNLRSAEIRVWPGGRMLLHHGAPTGELLVAPSEPVDSSYTLRYRTREEGDSDIPNSLYDFDERVCVLIATPPGAPAHTLVRVRIAADIEPLEDRLGEFLLPLVVLDCLFVLAAALLGRHVSGRIVKPLIELRAAAVRAREGSTEPMPRERNGDELDQLAEVLEDSFTELNAALERQVRFTADAAHELRNPITAVMNTAEVALRRPRDPEANHELFRGVLTESRRMAEVLEALLALARCDRGQTTTTFTPLDLGALARSCVREWMEHESAVPVDVQGTATMIGDPSMLRVLLLNLIENATRYSPPGEGVLIRLRDAAGIAVIEVTDHGPGIPAAEREQVFERFYRSANEGSGGTAGLGLSIVQAIVELHGGVVEAADADPGTVIRMRFSPTRLVLDGL